MKNIDHSNVTKALLTEVRETRTVTSAQRQSVNSAYDSIQSSIFLSPG